MRRLASAVLPLIFLLLTPLARGQSIPSMLNVRHFGAKGDGQTDDTAAFQKAMDAMAKAGGGTVMAPRGAYFFAGHLHVPAAVTLSGIWQSVPAHNGLRDPGLPKPTDDGTTFLVTEGAGSEAGPAFITLNTNSTLKGVVLYYPKQKPDDVPSPYPYAIAMRGQESRGARRGITQSLLRDRCFANERHLIRNVQGQPLRRGVFVDAIYDIGRIENVHFNPWWSNSPKLVAWQMANGEAFIVARSDWQYMLNTFCFGYNVGYKFIKSGAGSCNGNFLGLGADDCWRAVVVEQSAPFGLLITNGEFVSFHGPDPTMVEVVKGHTGSVRFVNCAFWGPCQQIAKIAGQGTVGFSDCTFVQWDSKGKGNHAVQVESGTVLVRGCEFRANRPQIQLGEAVDRAVITDNVFAGPVQITNHSKGSVQIANNAARPATGERAKQRGTAE